MSPKAAAAALVLALLTTGCGGPRDLNPTSPILIRQTALISMRDRFPNLVRPGAVTQWSGGRLEVWIPDDLSSRETIRLTIHELLKHVGPALYPDSRAAFLGLLQQIDTPEFPAWQCAKMVGE